MNKNSIFLKGGKYKFKRTLITVNQQVAGFIMASMARLEKECDGLMVRALNDKVFPGSGIGVIHGTGNEGKGFIKSYGKSSLFPEERANNKEIFYDIASLTKPLATTLALLSLCTEGKIKLTDTVGDILSSNVPENKRKIQIKELLDHSSGLPAHRPYFEKCMDVGEEAGNIFLRRILEEEPICKPGEIHVYSDLGYILLGFIIEEITKNQLDRYIVEKVFKPVGQENNIFFKRIGNESEKDSQRVFAPTEECPVRKKIVCGEVHDLNAFALGGVAGHAGLFANIEGVLGLGRIIMELWHGYDAHPNMATGMLREWVKKGKGSSGSTWVPGFDTPSVQGSSSGRYLSAKSIGHLGYTGTSIWIDMERKLVMVLLTNRIHPSDKNIKIRQFRPLFHNMVVESLGL